jgi:hypothetical protein
MLSEDDVERAIQALLDGRPLDSLPGFLTSAPDAACLVAFDAIARAHRRAVLGADAAPDEATLARWGRLEIRGAVGRGASGTVYRAWDPQLAREVALKLFEHTSGPGNAWLEEGRLLARLNHPHIVKVFGADTVDGIAGIWMELLEGQTLDEILERDGVCSVQETLLAGIDLAGALSAVHGAGLLHRDVKARNVLRERGGRLVLMDLGAGRLADAVPEYGDGTGTPMYMSPEVLSRGQASVESDIYGLGVLLYRMLTGEYPLEAETLEQLKAAHANGTRRPLDRARPGLRHEITTVVERACDAQRSARYSSAAQFEAALAAALRSTVSEDMPVASTTWRAWLRWRPTAVAVVGAIAVVALAGWAGWNTVRGRDTRRALGMTVPPKSPLYLSGGAAIAIVRDRNLTLLASNPATASVIAIEGDRIRTMAGIWPFTTGAGFTLDGLPLAVPRAAAQSLCCFEDGTTDGRYNYAPRKDDTPVREGRGRPLASNALYRFERDWLAPRVAFFLNADGVYHGVAYSAVTGSFWLTRTVPGGTVIEEWSRNGVQLSAPVRLTGDQLIGLAADPADGTLWAVRQVWAGPAVRLENYDTSGRQLGALEFERPYPGFDGLGAEFPWPGHHGDSVGR